MPHAQMYLANTKTTQGYFYKHFISFCFSFIFCLLSLLSVYVDFCFLCFCGVWLLFVCLFIFVVLRDGLKEKEHKAEWVEGGKDLGGVGREEIWLKYILWKHSKQKNSWPLRTDLWWIIPASVLHYFLSDPHHVNSCRGQSRSAIIGWNKYTFPL